MKPSLLSTSSTLTRSLEPGVDTFGFFRICALVMRAIISPSGSFNCMRASSPARLHEARDQALGTELAKRDTTELVLAIERTRPARHFAAIADAGLTGVARHFGKLQRSGEALFHRLGLVHDDRFQAVATAARLLRHPATAVVLLDRTLLRH